MTNQDYKNLSKKEFARAAAKYETDNAGVYKICRKDYADIIQELEKEPFNKLLDIGCGTGTLISLLAKIYPNKQFVGLDLTPEMIFQAEMKQINCAEFLVGDSENMPFESDSFDTMICSMSFHHYPNPQAFFDNVLKCLKPNGRLIIRDITSDSSIIEWFCNNIEMPLVRLFSHGDFKMATRKTITKCCQNIGLIIETFEIRKGMRLHCVIRKAK